MSANTKAPDSCPVCGGTDGIERRIYRETTIDRLTRERDLAREALERYEARVKRLEESGNELLWALCPASTSMMTERESDALKLWNEAKEAKP